MPTSQPNIASDNAAAPASENNGTRSPRWWFVHGGVVLAFVLFFLFVALLYWNWLRIQEPTASLRITGGSPAYDGAIVRVEGRNLNQPLELPLSEENRFGGRIYLRPGIYRVSVLRDGNLLFEPGEASIYEWRESTLTLPEADVSAPPQPESPES